MVMAALFFFSTDAFSHEAGRFRRIGTSNTYWDNVNEEAVDPCKNSLKPADCTNCHTPSAPVAPKRLPDLMVKEIKCGAGNKLQFTVANMGGPLPLKWIGKSHVWINGSSLFDSIDLKNAATSTGGGIAAPGGTSTYITPHLIVTGILVKVETDYGNYIKEANEGNNALVSQLKPCEVMVKPAFPAGKGAK